MDSFRKSHSSASGLAVQWLGDKWEMLLGVSIMIKITAITRATLLTRDREKVLRASNAPLDSKLLLQRCSSSPSPARAGSAPHNWGVPRALQQAGVTVPIRSWAFCSFCGLVLFALHLVGNACTLAQPLLQGRLVPPGSGRQGLTSAYSLLTADSGAAAVHEFCRLSETLHLIGNI